MLLGACGAALLPYTYIITITSAINAFTKGHASKKARAKLCTSQRWTWIKITTTRPWDDELSAVTKMTTTIRRSKRRRNKTQPSATATTISTTARMDMFLSSL